MSWLCASSIRTRITGIVTSWTVVLMETVARLSLGQTILRFIDRFLWIVEKSSEWSLPCHRREISEENGKSFGQMTLVRPLPWIFFFPGLILLRIFRIVLNVGALILDLPKIEISEMVKYLQKTRRRLRAIKSNGMKSMRERRAEDCAVEAKQGCERLPPRFNAFNAADADRRWNSVELIRSIGLALSSLSCLDGGSGKLSSPSPPPVKIKVGANHESTPTPEEKSTTESASSPVHVEYKRKYSDVHSDEYTSDDSEVETMTLRAKIDRIVAQTHDRNTDDDDYRPEESSDNESPNDADSSSVSGDSNVSATEIRDIRIEANQIYKRSFAAVEAMIKEEPEPAVKRSDVVDDDERRIMAATAPDSTRTETTAENSSRENHQQERYYSPVCKLGDGEEEPAGDYTAFYSPISSKSSSPERTLAVAVPCAPTEQTQQIVPKEDNNGVEKTNVHRNGNPNPAMPGSNVKARIPDDRHPADIKTTNGHVAAADAGDKSTAATDGATTAGNTNANANPPLPKTNNKSHYRARRTSNNLPTNKKNK